MCGIVGLVSLEKAIDRNILTQMRDTLIHRGPDDAGIYLNNDRIVGLGHRRLSIIDLSTRGRQPMSNEDGTIWLTYNGEIYNFQSLKIELEKLGHIFKSNTDSEVIIHAYEEWNEKCLDRFRGMFAFGIWDEVQNKLFLARDRLGIKPLYYCHDENLFIFASELKAIEAYPDLDKSIDRSALYDYLTYRYVPTPKTPYKKVKKLEPGHFIVYQNGKLNLSQYWDVDFGRNQINSEADAIEGIRDLLNESVKMRLVSDVPLGILLSGGVDSSCVTAFASKNLDYPVHTFSIGFDVEEHSETKYASIVAKTFSTNHIERIVDVDSAKQLCPKLLDMYDEPFADSSAIPTHIVSKVARENVTVALSGDGGDEVFGGYSWYTLYLKFQNLKFLPSSLKKVLKNMFKKIIPNNIGYRKTLLVRSMMDGLESYVSLMGGFTREEKKGILNDDILKEFRDYDDYWYFRKYWRWDLDVMPRLQYLDLKTYLHDDILTKVDRASMATSLEVRVPLLDHKLVEFVASIEPDVRNKNDEKKYIFKKSLSNILPDEILFRKKKGFSIPMSDWLRRGLIGSLGNKNKFFIKRNLQNLSVSSQYWLLAILDEWFQENLP